jgi:hypothetical protein
MESFDRAGTEPRLAALLVDPVIQLVMRRDRITEREVNAAIAIARRALPRRDDAGHDAICQRPEPGRSPARSTMLKPLTIPPNIQRARSFSAADECPKLVDQSEKLLHL